MKLFFSKLFSILTRHDKKFLAILIVFSISISLIEVIGITAILPFISIANDFTIIHSNPYFSELYVFFHFTNEIDFVIVMGALLLVFYILRSILNLGYFYLLAKFAKGRYHLLAYRLFENYLGMSYRAFIEKSSAEISKTILSEANNLTALLAGLLLMLSELFVFIFIYSAMMYINWKITLLITLLLFINVLILIRAVSIKIKSAGIQQTNNQLIFYKIILNTLGNFKMIKLSSDTKLLLSDFDNASSSFAQTAIRNDTLLHIPRIFLETLGFSIVIGIILYLLFKYQTDISHFLPLISMFVLALYRLMPSANRILSGYNQIIFNKSALNIVHNDLMYDPENLFDDPISFEKTIVLDNLDFEYIENKPIIRNLSLNIQKGDKIAFVGESGSGKSTLVDMIIGLYRPKNGKILIDGIELNERTIKAWRSKIGYIPQSIYLFDGTVAENITLGTQADPIKIRKALEQAKILDFLETHHHGIYTSVGDGGVKLSGGQKQRIAIARAIYNDPEILVLDEATSALDNETEASIMNEIYTICENKTLIVIAHRLTTIEKCARSYTLDEGSLI